MKKTVRAFSLISGLIIAAAFSQSAFAELVCPGLQPRPFSSIETKIDLGGGKIIDSKNIDCKKVAVGADMVTNIRKMLGKEVASPAQIKFRMVDQFDNAFFNPEDISLNVPYKLVLGDYSKNPVYSIPVWAHEFGHAILDYNLAKMQPKWVATLVKRMENRENIRRNSAGVVDYMLGSYHEFFADVVAVLYTGKGDIVSRGIYMTGFIANEEGRPGLCPNSDPKCRPRTRGHASGDNASMRVSLTQRDFTDRSNELSRWTDPTPNDSHTALAPARYDLYKYYIANPLYRHQESTILAILGSAIVNDVSRRIDRITNVKGIITDDAIDAEFSDNHRLNSEFMKTLDSYLDKGLRK
ncbi:MAG: hypothetical protein H7301_08920 [Cryobacterium sp.]|nr:hypothetical protein [Oligoflexia bacterium]